MGIATSSTLTLARSKLHVAAPYLIEQTWANYTPEQHATWAELVTRRMPQLREHACREYLDGFEFLGLPYDRLPNLAALQGNVDLTRDLGLVRSSVDVKKIADLSFVEEAAKRLK